MPGTAAVALAILCYLLGSIPFGLMLTRLAGAGDIRRIGSGNIGATNVLRTGRRGLAAATLLLDAAKGALAVVVGSLDPGPAGPLGSADAALAALCVVVGHCFPVWLRFQGGKGVATALGAAVVLCWPVGAAACLAWLAAAWLSRRSSVGALAAMLAAAVGGAALGGAALGGAALAGAALGGASQGRPAGLALVLVALLVTGRHHANIRRLLAGSEPKIGARA